MPTNLAAARDGFASSEDREPVLIANLPCNANFLCEQRNFRPEAIGYRHMNASDASIDLLLMSALWRPPGGL